MELTVEPLETHGGEAFKAKVHSVLLAEKQVGPGAWWGRL